MAPRLQRMELSPKLRDFFISWQFVRLLKREPEEFEIECIRQHLAKGLKLAEVGDVLLVAEIINQEAAQ